MIWPMSVVLMGLIAISAYSPWEAETVSRDAKGTANAAHFVLYRGMVQHYTHQNAGLSAGNINDSSLTFPAGMNAPSFDHQARLHGDGYLYVWSAQDGAFYRDVAEEDPDTLALCHVLESRQCVRHSSSESMLTASQTPAFLAPGSTVYVWKY